MQFSLLIRQNSESRTHINIISWNNVNADTKGLAKLLPTPLQKRLRVNVNRTEDKSATFGVFADEIGGDRERGDEDGGRADSQQDHGPVDFQPDVGPKQICARSGHEHEA